MIWIFEVGILSCYLTCGDKTWSHSTALENISDICMHESSACVCFLTWVQDELHLGFKSLFCGTLSRCFDRLLKRKLLKTVLSIYFPCSIIFGFPKLIHHLQRCQWRCQDVNLSFFTLPLQMRFSCQNDRGFRLQRGPSKMSETSSCTWVAN